MTAQLQLANAQIGQSATATQNFTLEANNDGKLAIKRGNHGASSSTPLTINADDSISGNAGLGVDQTRQLFTVGTTRVNGTTYTNSTGKTITVYVQFNVSSAVNCTVGGVVMVSGSTGAGVFFPYSFTVKNGETYSCTGVGIWTELR